ncbi:hypothetical protein K505DRAFT_28231 [Melanomma pulvis-pyrius CBS 109.77]|uniref:Uncharacterized protein n=1 Tax=Melanomma pulvis-pyrius CBS 109.77 TaxID=1314802 RepID=A0A6A6XCN3_9PLEO|nr:hypothetical protein K505DRAFT_28231 [Melanomma pulvis-pyrius CBS 109.77]
MDSFGGDACVFDLWKGMWFCTLLIGAVGGIVVGSSTDQLSSQLIDISVILGYMWDMSGIA